MRYLATIAAAAVGLVLAGAAPATSLLPVQKAALEAVRRAVAAGQIDASQAAIDRAEIGRAARLIRGLPAGRGNHVGVALAEVASLSGRLTGPRAVALFGQLRANDDYFARRWAPADKTDITDASGVVYRYFSGRCFEFHPLANFGELNADVARGDVAATRLLADALVARGVYQHGGGIGWEYYFSFGGGRAPWLSGMAQAVAAQALARAATLVTDETTLLTRQARGAYRTIPGRLLTGVAAGPWIRLYAFRSTAVLNAQLQAVISLQSYAAAVEDASAAALAARMQHAAAATLPKFDTGYWTYYSLARDPSPLEYQRYVVQLLTKLASADPRFADAATRFASYLHQPPAFKLANGGLGEVRFWLSKPATVNAVSAAGKTHHVALDAGWHTLSWREPTRTGTYPVELRAVDWAGNHVALEALPIVRAAAAQVAQSRRTTADVVTGQPAFVVGAGLDDPAQGTLAQALGMRLVRLGVAWPSGATAADPALVAAFQTLPASLGALVELAANPLPTDAAAQAALAQYAASIAQQVPGLRYLVLTPSASAAGAPAYAAALAAIRTAVQGAVPGIPVGIAIDGSSAPKATVAALGRAFATAGGAAPYADLVAFRPVASPAPGQWTAANVLQLVSALSAAFGRVAPEILIDGIATPTTIPTAELESYPVGQPQAPGAVSARAQGAGYAASITAAACSPSIAGVVLDRLSDNASTPAPPTGVLYPSGNAKASAATVTAAAGPAQRGTIVCPGLAAPVTATKLTFPTELTSIPAPLTLACSRDCLYLVTLDRADGRPIVARRGALRANAEATIRLPQTKLAPGNYRFNVRVVSQVNPGPVTQLTSPPLATT